MFKPLSAFVALRYLRARRRTRFVSFISLASLLGTAIGVWSLVTVMSVMNGYEAQVRSRILSMIAHATIEGVGGGLDDWREVLSRARAHPEVRGAAPFTRAQAMLMRGGRNVGVLLEGIDPARQGAVSDLGDHLLAGTLDALAEEPDAVILGKALAERLEVAPGDRIRAVAPAPGGLTMPRLRGLRVRGIFELGLYEFDSRVALVSLDTAAVLTGREDVVGGIRLRLADPYSAPRVVREIVRGLDRPHLVSDWTRRYSNLFRALGMQKRMLFLVLVLIVAVAAFNIVSTLVMVVMDKQGDIAILRTMGAGGGLVRRIFILQGLLLGGGGALFGIAAGVLTARRVDAIVSTLERWLGVDFLPADVYNVTRLVGLIRWDDVAQIGAAALLLSLLATLYPAWRAARVDPARALRYE